MTFQTQHPQAAHGSHPDHPETPLPAGQSGFQIEGDPQGHSSSISLPPAFESAHDSLPSSYSSTRLWAAARDPHRLFVYWQLQLPLVRIPGARLALVFTRADGAREATLDVAQPSGSRFIPVSQPGCAYRLSLGFLPHADLARGAMVLLIAERTVVTPRATAVTPDPPPQRSALFTPPPLRRLLWTPSRGGAALSAGTMHGYQERAGFPAPTKKPSRP